ncbi:MAG TPA: GNAT family N-acetyltransferase [Polyangiaceae bacterium]|jgi:ribosomal protein S18 acetylase RimI-like enzyme|nr:GNAT family N-acetyltransferase [Polyangiaceae bacterium]
MQASVAAITIREARESDAALLAELNRSVQALHVAALPEYFKVAEPAAVADLYRTKLQSLGFCAWIAWADTVPVGHALAVVRERPENALCTARRFFEIDEIAVSPMYRKQGVARGLVERALSEARARGIRDVELSSWAFNGEAHAAFRALGFEPKVLRFGRESG